MYLVFQLIIILKCGNSAHKTFEAVEQQWLDPFTCAECPLKSKDKINKIWQCRSTGKEIHLLARSSRMPGNPLRTKLGELISCMISAFRKAESSISTKLKLPYQKKKIFVSSLVLAWNCRRNMSVILWSNPKILRLGASKKSIDKC